MPQVVKKRRSGWAILAAGALVASLFAVGASPAAASPANGDVLPSWTACLGEALEPAGFEDVAMGGAHYNNINCLAHYGITQGRTATEFAPRANVTREQMALFLTRAAAAASLELSDKTDHEFTDLGDTLRSRAAAIVTLVNSGVMSGRSATTFDPLGTVSRSDMAEHLVALVAMSREDLEQDDDDLLYRFDDNVITGDPGDSDDLPETHDEEIGYFTDVYTMSSAPAANAIYTAFELGITTGYTDGTFKPNRGVTRQEMASFIMRALAHTNLRPANLSGQRSGNPADGYEIQISMRTADFAPVANEPVDVFFTNNRPEAAFDDGACVVYPFERVDDVKPSQFPCVIDTGDMVTDGDGNAPFSRDVGVRGSDESDAVTLTCRAGDPVGGTYTIKGESPAIDIATTFYAWSGELRDEVMDDTNLVVVTLTSAVRPSRSTPTTPDHALVDGGLTKASQTKVKFGEDVTYTLQLRAIVSNADGTDSVVDSGPDKSGNTYTLRDSRTQDGTNIHLVSSLIEPKEDGSYPIPITQADPTPGANNDEDVIVSLTLTRNADNTAVTGDTGAFRDAKDNAFDSPLTNAQLTDSDLELEITFSDAEREPGEEGANWSITAKSDSEWQRAPRANATATNKVTVTVIDEYGDPVRGFAVRADSGLNDGTPPDPSVFPFVQYYTTNRSGQYPIGYTYAGGPATETLNVSADPTPKDDNPDTVVHESADTITRENAATIHWAGIGRLAGAGDGVTGIAILATAADMNLFVVNSEEAGLNAAAPHIYQYDDVDTYELQGTAVSMEEFERAITTVVAHQLRWTGYNPSFEIDRSTWDADLTCTGSN